MGVIALGLPEAKADPVRYAANGHYYEAVRAPDGITRDDAGAAAFAKGGYLATITDAAENDFVFALVNDLSWFTDISVNGDRLGPWLGGIKTAAGWQWNTGEPFTYTNWKPGQPDGFGGGYQYTELYNGSDVGSAWADHPGNDVPGFELPKGYVVEYNTDPSTIPAVAVAPPRLDIAQAGAQEMTLSWPADLTGWTLEYCDDLSSTWTTVATAPVIDAGKFKVPVTTDVPKRIYRLRR